MFFCLPEQKLLLPQLNEGIGLVEVVGLVGSKSFVVIGNPSQGFLKRISDLCFFPAAAKNSLHLL